MYRIAIPYCLCTPARAGGATICLANRVPGSVAQQGIDEMTFDKVIEKKLLVYESSGKV